MKIKLTDRKLQSFKSKAKQYYVSDADTPGLCVRVCATGPKTFCLLARFPGSPFLKRRRLGEYPSLSLADARDRARDWKRLLGQGKDPSAEEEKRRRAELRKQAHLYGAVAEEYFADMKRRGLRRGREVENEMRREFKAWERRPIADIDRADVIALVEAVAGRSPWQAHHMLSYASRFFNWAIQRGIYGLESSPCERIRPTRLIGPKEPRQRVLDDDEIRQLWTACTDYPYGLMCCVLLLTGQRRAEVAGMRWSETDLAKRVWTIPPTRAKSGAAHVVPLTDAVIELLEGLPRFSKADFVFTTTLGAKPINGFSKYKARLDARLKIAPFVLHDIRRTVRTR